MKNKAVKRTTRVEHIQSLIRRIRGQKVILDTDLAQLYGVETKAFNRAVKRHASRFPPDFMFRLTKVEFDNLKYQFGTSSSGHGGRRKLPWAFTAKGRNHLSHETAPPTADVDPVAHGRGSSRR